MIFHDEAEFVDSCGSAVTEIAAILTEKHAWAATAESLTGGLLASEIVRVAGSSRWFSEGCVTYTDAAKARRLLIPPEFIAEHDAVSRAVAKRMAEGMLLSSGADVSVSTTGLAGPGRDALGREAGLVFIGGATKFGSVTKELALSGSRLDIRRQTVYEALRLLLELSRLI